jgi:hypothetical protein
MFGAHGRLEKQLRESGAKATGVVIESRETTGTTQHGDGSVDKIWEVKLSVQPAGEPAFEANIKQYFRQTTQPLPGATFEVLYDPADHSKVVIDMEYLKQIDPRPHELRKSDPEAYKKRMSSVAVMLREAALTSEGMGGMTVFLVGGGDGAFVGPGGMSPAPVPGEDIADTIKRIADLRDAGIITEGEFEFHKKLLLATGVA